MRIAIISDIHANKEGLDAALAEIRKRGADEIVCLGDIVGYGASPNECVETVRSVTSRILLGNHDEAALYPEKAEYFNPYARIAVEWTYDELSEDHRNFLRGLPFSTEIGELLFVHSSPLEPSEWHYIITLADASDNFSFFQQPICFVGHSHVPEVFCTDGRSETVVRGLKFIVNVGSVGQPRDGNPQLSFGMFDTDAWVYENVRLDYDVQTAASKIRKAGLPKALADRLLVGR